MNRIINGVFGLSFNAKGQVLLTQRFEPETPDAHLKWQLPGGGQEFGEDLPATLKREMLEELGLRVEILDERPIVGMNIWAEGSTGQVQVNLFTYLIAFPGQTPEIGDAETNDWKWVDVEEVEKMPQLPGLTQIVHSGYRVLKSHPEYARNT